MAVCQVTLGVESAVPFQNLFRERARPSVPESAESLPQQHEPLRALLDALSRCVDASEAGAVDSSSQEDLARLLRSARRQLEEQLDEATTASSWESSKEAALRLLSADVPSRLVVCLGVLDFEVQKDAIRLFEVLLRTGTLLDVGAQIIEYVVSHPNILQMLLEGAGTPEVHWQCAQMIRNCACSPHLVKALTEKGAANRLMELMQHQNFDIASEAFSCLKELLLGQKEVSSAFLEANFQEVFGMWHALLQDEDYVRQRQALKLLGEILLDRSFMEVMVQYVSNEQFLQIHMKLLRHSSKVIQTDAFHVFKAFVGNPSKPRRVHQILYQNKDRLEKLLSTFYTRREGDDAFLDDLNVVIPMIQALEPPPRSQSRRPSLSCLDEAQSRRPSLSCLDEA